MNGRRHYINEVLREALNRYVFVYLDNILIYSQTVDEHVTHVRRVQLLRENHLFVKQKKSTLHTQTISFLGFVISHNKLCMYPAKHPDAELPFVTEVDASHEVGIGAVLSQWSAEDKKLHPCAYFSRRLSPAERNYDVGDHELLVVKLALEDRPSNSIPGLILPYHTGRALRTFKPDALSLQWGVEKAVHQALLAEPDPDGGLLGRLYVPKAVRAQVLEQRHLYSSETDIGEK
ncbi:hypothetical protein P4O66_011525 [Electrophorus voltai]|uniref:ribonuclease H n=1 Tax=Electrophorus voltai TaxID=2609070 RepID=A0AAD8Z824_9TELE|nr:hypothetical protein P4O66_011525 [Electrophorus voltai]